MSLFTLRLRKLAHATPTQWRVTSTGGGGISAAAGKAGFGAGAGQISVQHGSDGPQCSLQMAGLKGLAGLGMSSPVNFEGSIPELPGGGIGQIVTLPGQNSSIGLSDLKGPTLIVTPSVAFCGASVGLVLIFFGVPAAGLGALWATLTSPTQMLSAAADAVAEAAIPTSNCVPDMSLTASRAVAICSSTGGELSVVSGSVSALFGFIW